MRKVKLGKVNKASVMVVAVQPSTKAPSYPPSRHMHACSGDSSLIVK